MVDLQMLKAAIDDLDTVALNEIYRYIVQVRQPSFWLIPGENLKAIREIMRPVHAATAHLTEDEINKAIDEAIDEVRGGQRAESNGRY